VTNPQFSFFFAKQLKIEEKIMDLIIDKSKLEDKRISIAIMSSFAILMIQYLILVYFNFIDTSKGEIVQLISKGIVGFLYLLALPIVLKRNKIKFIGLYFIASFLFICNYFFFNENYIYIKSIILPFFFTGLPSYIYAYSIRDWDIFAEVMRKAGNIVFIVGTILGLLVVTGNASIGTYSMSLSYYMLLPSIIYMNDFLDKMHLKSGVILGVSLLIILALGSRGALMCIGAFAILKLIKQVSRLTYKNIMLYLLLFFVIFISLIFWDGILEYIYNFLLRYGIKSRSIILFLQGEIYLSGRDILYKNVIKEILNNPLLGIGLSGDRRVLGGIYVHNIFIEILSNFGVVLGSYIIILLIYVVIKSLLREKSRKYNIIIIWISIGFIHLLVSSSYLIDFKFWIMIGLISKSNN